MDFLGERVALLVRGNLDLSTGSELETILAAVARNGHHRVVLDLAECDFIDAAGFRVITTAAENLDRLGGELTIRSPSGVVRRLLDLVGPAVIYLFGPPEVATGPLGGLEPVHADGVAVRTAPGGSPSPQHSPVTVAAHNDVVDAALRLVVALACATVEGADGVSVSLRRQALLSTVAASDQTIREMDAGQYASGEGPCVDASIQGQSSHSGSLDTETRWPTFTPIARALGINAILSSPLLANDRPVGALNIYSRTVEAFATKSQHLASVFSAEASTILSEVCLDPVDNEISDRFGAALATRQVIALAQGVTMERDRLDENDAYTALRRFSANSGRPLRERAEDIVASVRWPAPEVSTGTEHRDG